MRMPELRFGMGVRFREVRTAVLLKAFVPAATALMLLLSIPQIISAQNCHDPINGCSPSDQPPDDDSGSGGTGYDSCSSCPELAAEYADVLALYSGSDLPGPALTEPSDTSLVDSDTRLLQRLLVSLGSDEYSSKAQEMVGNAADSYTEVSSSAVELGDRVERMNMTENSSVGGDPNILASGTLIHSESDITMILGEARCAVERTYRSDRSQWSSFGPGWNTTADARIVLGTAPALAPVCLELRSVLVRLEELIADSGSAIDEAVALLRDHHDQVIAPHREIAEQVEARAHALYDLAVEKASGSGRAQVIAECEELYTRSRSTADHYRSMLDSLSTSRSALAELLQGNSEREAVGELAASIARLETRAENEYHHSLANEAKNRMAVHDEDPPEYSRCGVDSVTLIDGEGVPHLYRFAAQPDYERSATVYADGSRCYYPDGISLTPANPLDPPLLLEPDGSWSLLRRNGSGEHFDSYGLIEHAADRNGNAVRFKRSNGSTPVAITDSVGRSITVDSSGGRITAVVDPLGRTVRYSYDSAGRLSSVTDAVGCAVRYRYSGSLLTAIEKPDGSRITYDYAEHMGHNVLVATTDEEGYTEQFAYGEGQTVHLDRSGVETAYCFDPQMREIVVEHSDGSRRSTEYDERGRILRRTDELGASITYERDTHGNALLTTFADGSTRSARYDAADRIVEETDQRGFSTAYSYDARGNLVSMRYPDGGRRTFTYDTCGNRLSSSGEAGAVTYYTYDRYGYLQSERAPDGGLVRFEHDAVGNLVSVVDQLGNRTRFEYAGDNLLTAIVDPAGQADRFRYDLRKDLVEHVDRIGGSTRYDYDKRHLCVRIVDPAGVARAFRYRADGRIGELAVDDRAPIRYGYDDRGRLSSIEQLNYRRSFERDAAGRIVSATDPDGNTSRLLRDAFGRITAIVDPLGNARGFGYDAAGNLVWTRDAAGAVTQHQFDARDRPTAIHDALGGWRHLTYDADGNLSAFTDERGATTSYEYDPCNRLQTVCDALGGVQRYAYSPRGELSAYTDRCGNTWSYAYNPSGLMTAVIDPLGGRRTISYDALGRPIAATDQNGNTSRFEFDGAGRLTAAIDPYGETTSFSYQSLDTIASITGKRGDTWQYAFDPFGRLVSAADPLGYSRTFRYDANGNIIASGDACGAETRFEYDELNRLSRRVDPTGATMQWSYDADGRLLAETDPLGRVYRWSYDELGRLIGETNRAGRTRRYAYDRAGNPVSEWDFNGNETRYDYDLRGRMITVDGRDGRSTFAYDSEGNLVGAHNPVASYRFEYDALARLVSTVDETSGLRSTLRYDANGNCVERRDTGVGGVTCFQYGKNNELLSVTDARQQRTLFEYDAAGNLVGIQRPNGISQQREYDLAGRSTSNIVRSTTLGWTGPAVWGQVYLYDPAGRKIYSFDSADGTSAYRYDAAGRLVETALPPQSSILPELARRASELNGPRSYPAAGAHTTPSTMSGERAETATAEYLDITPQQAVALRELIESNMPPSRSLFQSHPPVALVSFAYDAAGNRVSQTGPWGETDFRYGPDHELLSAGRRMFAYDRNGNLARETFGDEEIQYRYSGANRLTEILFSDRPPVHPSGDARSSASPTSVEYAYDPLGRRTLRRTHWISFDHAVPAPAVSSGVGQQETERLAALTEERYDYEGLTLRIARASYRTLQTDPLAKEPAIAARGGRYRYLGGATANRTGPPADVVSRLYANGLLLETVSNGETVYHSSDCLGSIVASTDSRGTVVGVTSYSPFGASALGSDGQGIVPGFSGKDFDPLTGLYNFGLRDYSPLLGRWTTPDPIKSGTNWYLYAQNDPVNFIDPNGLILESVSLTYYQDVNPRTGVPEPYAGKALGLVLPSASADTDKVPETIGKHGCLLTAATRIANSINHEESTTPDIANFVALDNGLFVPSSSGQVDELTPQSTANLISELTSTSVAQERYFGPREQLEAELTRLNYDSIEHYVIGHIVVGEGDSAYSHYINIQAIDNEGVVQVADTSVTNREHLAWSGERMVDIMVFTSKAK